MNAHPGNGSQRGPFVILCMGFANGQPCPVEGQFLEWYEPNGRYKKKTDTLSSWTPDIKKALMFLTIEAAFTCWKQERTVLPNPRPDGKPNRPLTAFSIQVRPIDG